MALSWWVTDSLAKVFQDSLCPPNPAKTIVLHAAGGETEDAQIAIEIPKDRRVNRAAWTATPLKGPRGHGLPATATSCHWQWFVPVVANPPGNTDPADVLRKAPAFFPDGFLEPAEVPLRGGVTEPLWVSIRVPAGTPAGRYRGRIDLTFAFTGTTEKLSVPVELDVWNFALPATPTFRHTEWAWVDQTADYYHLERWGPEHWGWIERIALDMAAHRQDMINTPFHDLVDEVKLSKDNVRFEFRKLDRWLDIFQKAGVTWVEGWHVAGRHAGWNGPITLNRPAKETERFIKAVYGHLKARGLAHKCVQHVADEPTPQNRDSYLKIANAVKRWLPGVRRIDALMDHHLGESCEIRVPQIQETMQPWTRKNGRELWSYVCVFPQGKWPNRFIDYPSVRNRILFWLSHTMRLNGFLHWGYNYWKPWQGLPHDIPLSPWTDTTGGSAWNVDTIPLPAGDPFLVYPGKNGLCSSIRWEVIRKGCEDYELLQLLAKAVRTPKRKSHPALKPAKELLQVIRTEVAPDPATHTRDSRFLLGVRRSAGELLSALS